MDYLERGINSTGHYYMFVNGSSTLESIYCKFDALHFGTCDDYYIANNQSESGRYWVYLNSRPYDVNCDFSSSKSTPLDIMIHDFIDLHGCKPFR